MKVAVLSFAHEDAAAYVRLLRDMPGVDLITADPGGPPGDPARGRAAAGRLGVAYADGWDEAFAQRPGAVVVTSEAARRRELVERAARTGAHVLCAFPSATDEAGARAAADACEAAGVGLTLALPACFGPAFAAVRRAVAEGDAVGRLTTLHGAYDGGPGTGGPDGGGVLATHAPVLLALADMVLGGEPAEQVYAQANGVLGGSGEPGAESAALVSVRYASGAVAAFDCSRRPPANGPSVNGPSVNGAPADGPWAGGPVMTFVGDRGSVEFTPTPRLLGGFDAATATERWEPGGVDLRAAMLDAFLASAGHGKPTEPNGPDGATGVRTMRIIHAAYESVHTGQPVDLAAAPTWRRA
ncbi:MAG TPA: Gfo/Idh/MocA family oxidoreductase [Streptomyces sp.]|nr:Gfo/Idh/MocA family oxidoreductase [Streptomyces sp.]